MNTFKCNKAFSLIELSIVILIIGLLVAGVSKGSQIYNKIKLASARSLTNSSVVNSTKALELWLETTSANSFLEVSPEDNESINNWFDINLQSTFKNNAEAFNNSQNRRPLYVKNKINGLPVLKFDGIDDCMISSVDIRRLSIPNMTMFLVYERKLPIHNSRGGIIGNDPGWARFFIMNHSAIGGSIVSTGSTPHRFDAMGTADRPQILTYISRVGTTNGSSVAINRNLASTTYTENISITEQNLTSIGSHNSATCDKNDNVEIGEIIIFRRALQNGEVNSIEDYLSQKWGIKLVE